MPVPVEDIMACFEKGRAVLRAWSDHTSVTTHDFNRIMTHYRVYEFKETNRSKLLNQINGIFKEPCTALELPPDCMKPRHWRYNNNIVACMPFERKYVCLDIDIIKLTEICLGETVEECSEMYIREYEFKETLR